MSRLFNAIFHQEKVKEFEPTSLESSLKYILSRLERHIKTDHPGNYSLCFCPTCKMRLPNETYLDMHVKAEHDDRDLSCEKCDRRFASAKYFRIHMQSAHFGHEDEDLGFKCPKCAKISKNKKCGKSD